MKNNSGNFILGTILIGLGVVLFGNIYDFWHIDLFFAGWWTLFLIVPGAISIIRGGLNIGNLILTLVGVMLLLGQQEIIDDDMVGKLLFPVILISIGIFIFFGSLTGQKESSFLRGLRSGGQSNEDTPNYVAFFSGNDVKNNSQNLQGGSASAFFGGVTLDLRNARVNHDITFNTTAAFGGIEVMVPPQVRVRVTGLPLFGGNEVKVVSPADDSLPLITFNCLTLFGGTTIR